MAIVVRNVLVSGIASKQCKFKMAASNRTKIKNQKASRLSNKSKLKIYGKRQSRIGNASKGHACAEFRKLKVLHEYKKYKRRQKKKLELDDEDHVSETRKNYKEVKRWKCSNMTNKYQEAEVEYGNRKAEKVRLKKEAEEFRKKRDQEFRAKQEKRRETHRKLKQRTRRGQPIMSNHIECLLEKIERK